MQETVSETIEANPQHTKRPFFKRWWFWFVLLCLVAGGAFAVWKRQQPPHLLRKPGSKAPSLPTPVFVAAARIG